MGLREIFRVPAPGEKVARWHVSPLIDTSCYAFSWVWVLIPLVLFAGPDIKTGRELDVSYAALYVLILAFTDAHRHYTMPMIYLDRQVRRQYPARFLLLPAVLLVAWAASPYMAAEKGVVVPVATVTALVAYTLVLIQIVRRDGSQSAVTLSETAGLVAPAVVAFALTTIGDPLGIDAAWWWVGSALFTATYFDWRQLRRQPRDKDGERRVRFVYSALIVLCMGITLATGERIEAGLPKGGLTLKQVVNIAAVVAFTWNLWHFYMQKYGFMRLYNAKSEGSTKVPGWNDRLLIFCWLPLYFTYLVPQYSKVAMKKLPRGKSVIGPLADLMESVGAYLTPVAAALVVVTFALWFRAEWKANHLRNRPRLTMAMGTSIMGAAFLFVDPVKAYLAYAFSHSLEYMVFVWAFQRKRYQRPLPHDPLLGRLLRHPFIAYGAFTLALFGAFVYLKYYGRYVFPSEDRPELLGFRTSTWIAYWGIYQSMAHFYWDGFMWKMRLESVQKNI